MDGETEPDTHLDSEPVGETEMEMNTETEVVRNPKSLKHLDPGETNG